MTSQRLIFTDELIARARAAPEATRRLIYRWATFPGPEREKARSQLEAAARLVPVDQRPRVLGQLHSDDDKQVMATAGVVLLAKLLADQGWRVEHEPDISGVTPDLRIRKGKAEFLVEVRHVAGDFGLPPAYQRLEASLRDIRTRTPANFFTIQVDGRASLRGFKAFLRRALDEKATGRQVYEKPGILISFELLRRPLDREIGVFSGHTGKAFAFDDRPNVRAALDEKLKKYPFPLIVALQGIEVGDLFKAAEEELFGSEVIQIPISHATGGPAGPPRRARKPDDSILSRPKSDGARVRARLEALLPFEVNVTDRGFAVRARLLANPAKPGVVGLDEFRPIPSLLHLDARKMGYVGADGQPLSEQEEVADEFIP